LISVTTRRRLGGSVNADIVVIDGITTGDGVIMGDGKFREVGSGWDVADVLGWSGVGGDVARFSLVLLRFCIWLGGVIKVLQLEGVGRGNVIIIVVGSWWGRHPPVLIMAASQ
jgi:hypothetical protein